MKQEIAKLQKRMTTLGIDAFYIPCGDPHNSEYFPAHYRCAEFFSGLHAEAQELVITKDSAYLWTDGRYFLQADRELAGSDIELMKMGQPDVPSIPEFLADLSGGRADFTLAYDGNIVSAAKGARIAKSVAGHILTDIDPAEGIWTDRPMLEPAGIWELPLSSCGMTASEKIADVRSAMAEAGADILLLSDLMETAWTFNLRGNDIDYTPVFMSYAIITKDICELFVMDEAFEAPAELSFVKVRPYSEVTDALSELCSGTPVIWYDPEKVSVSVISAIPENTGRITNPTPVSEMKIIKNATETACTLNAHRKDGAAMVKFIYWLKNKLTDRTSLTEIDAADYLDNCRKSMDGFLDLSFNTISAYGPNGAVIHYAASPETNAEILPEGFLLVDSGAHYIDGTTDITRTIACGPLTDEMKKCYTLVLKSHIALARASLLDGRTDAEIDSEARKPLNDAGYDFNHGISHGVGHILSVHEGPNGIRRGRDACFTKPGCIQSDEPGIYLAGKYGIRIENEILCVGNEYADNGSLITGSLAGAGKDRPFSFRTITFCPYELEAILPDLLTHDEKAWLNKYNNMVRHELTPLLTDDEQAFLAAATCELQ